MPKNRYAYRDPDEKNYYYNRHGERRRRMRIEEWGADCGECGKSLDAWNALFSRSGLGPFCEQCVDKDPKMSGMTWFPKAESWDNHYGEWW